MTDFETYMCELAGLATAAVHGCPDVCAYAVAAFCHYVPDADPVNVAVYVDGVRQDVKHHWIARVGDRLYDPTRGQFPDGAIVYVPTDDYEGLHGLDDDMHERTLAMIDRQLAQSAQ